MTVLYHGAPRSHREPRRAAETLRCGCPRARLIVFLAAFGALIWTLVRRAGYGWYSLDALLFVVFGVLVAWHARIEARAAWHDALQASSALSAGRLASRERGMNLPPADPPPSIDSHTPSVRARSRSASAAPHCSSGWDRRRRRAAIFIWRVAPRGPPLPRSCGRARRALSELGA